MDESIISDVCQTALEKMPDAEYHNAAHAKKVSQEVSILARSETTEMQNVLRVAAAFHDTGHATGGADGHEERSCQIAKEVLLKHEFDCEFITSVQDAIMGTVFLSEPTSRSGRLLSDADVWSFGSDWDTFVQKTLDARDEFASEVSDGEWLAFRAYLLQEHTYYTPEGEELYQKQKQTNLDRCKEEYGFSTEPPWDTSA